MVKIYQLLRNSGVVVCSKLMFDQITYKTTQSETCGRKYTNQQISVMVYIEFYKMRYKREMMSECNFKVGVDESPGRATSNIVF